MRRPRYYLLNWIVPASPGVAVEQQAEIIAVSFTAKLPKSSKWVDPGWLWCGDTPIPAKGSKKVLRFQRSVPTAATSRDGLSKTLSDDRILHLPFFMRALPKKKETFMPAGIDNAPPDAMKRWKAHAWRYPPSSTAENSVSPNGSKGRLLPVCESLRQLSERY